MGDIANMMLEGDLCQWCGGFIDEEGGDGIPRSCGCVEDDENDDSDTDEEAYLNKCAEVFGKMFRKP